VLKAYYIGKAAVDTSRLRKSISYIISSYELLLNNELRVIFEGINFLFKNTCCSYVLEADSYYHSILLASNIVHPIKSLFGITNEGRYSKVYRRSGS